jgi:hypothetical protein
LSFKEEILLQIKKSRTCFGLFPYAFYRQGLFLIE